MSLRELVVFVAVFSAGSMQFSPTAWSAGPMRYGLKEGRVAAYDVEIVADMGNEVDTMKGRIQFASRGIKDNVLSLTYSGGLVKHTQYKQQRSRGFGPRFPPPPMIGPPGRGGFQGLMQTSNDLTLTQFGEFKTLRGESQLPHLLGNLCLLVFEPLPANNEQRWVVKNGINVSHEGGRPFFGSPFFNSPKESAAALRNPITCEIVMRATLPSSART